MAGTGESRLPDYVFSGSTRSRRLRVPSFLRRNPIIYRRPPRRSSLVASTDGVLNAARILAAAEVHTPSEAASVVLSGESLSRVDADDLALFRALQYLDVGDNNLRLQWLAALPSLNELHLHCNGIAHIVLDDASYPSLRILGLAYNGLTPASIGELARIPCLEELDLTCNDITRVPQDMSAFRTLKKLSLRRNLLRDDAVWHALGQIPSLEVLDISENALKTVPSSFISGNGGFSALVFLDASYNYLADESDVLALAGFTNLEMVDLRGNPLIKPAQRGLALRQQYPILYSSLIEPCELTAIIHEPKPRFTNDKSHLLMPDIASDVDDEEPADGDGAEQLGHVEPTRHEPDTKTFMTAVSTDDGDGWSLRRIEQELGRKIDDVNSAGHFADRPSLNVHQAMDMLRQALDHGLVYHTKLDERHCERKTASTEHREQARRVGHPDHLKPTAMPDRHGIADSKRYRVPRSMASVHAKFDAELDARLAKATVKPAAPVADTDTTPEFLRRKRGERDMKALLDLVMSKLNPSD
ncbi:hypothetical protein PBRA_007440 [Plasmodiophora brassicae]|uniref:Uncharacterized protein n=1 Tax=Plasmodiophora brassicae TaxID=37360 RepID=A0A0G4IWU7_PLABS|nr:hypothetical protein PBRA_007440 [Plasmodiophora brassicae]